MMLGLGCNAVDMWIGYGAKAEKSQLAAMDKKAMWWGTDQFARQPGQF